MVFGYDSTDFAVLAFSLRVHENRPKIHTSKTHNFRRKCEREKYDITSRAPKIIFIEPHEIRNKMRNKIKK